MGCTTPVLRRSLGKAGRAGAGGSRPTRFRYGRRRHRPPDDRVQPEQLRIDHEREAEIEFGFVLFEAGPLLHQLHQVPTVRLDDLVHVDAGDLRRHQDLDDELVARRGALVRGGAQPVASSVAPPGGDVKALLGAFICGVVGFDEPVTLSRPSFVYTWPTFNGQTSPVLASNSWRSCNPCTRVLRSTTPARRAEHFFLMTWDSSVACRVFYPVGPGMQWGTSPKFPETARLPRPYEADTFGARGRPCRLGQRRVGSATMHGGPGSADGRRVRSEEATVDGDIVIRGGSLIDGSGGPARDADVRRCRWAHRRRGKGPAR